MPLGPISSFSNSSKSKHMKRCGDRAIEVCAKTCVLHAIRTIDAKIRINMLSPFPPFSIRAFLLISSTSPGACKGPRGVRPYRARGLACPSYLIGANPCSVQGDFVAQKESRHSAKASSLSWAFTSLPVSLPAPFFRTFLPAAFLLTRFLPRHLDVIPCRAHPCKCPDPPPQGRAGTWRQHHGRGGADDRFICPTSWGRQNAENSGRENSGWNSPGAGVACRYGQIHQGLDTGPGSPRD